MCIRDRNYQENWGIIHKIKFFYRICIRKKSMVILFLKNRENIPVSYTHLITAGTLPLIVLVVFFSKTYVFSILLCVFYSVLNMSATALFDTLPKTMLWLLPTPLTTFWSAGDMAAHGIKMDLEQMTGLIPSTFQVVFILGIMALVSFLLIDRLYKQRGE